MQVIPDSAGEKQKACIILIRNIKCTYMFFRLAKEHSYERFGQELESVE